MYSDKANKPFILVIGDSMTKHLTSYDLHKMCKGARFMVRSLGGKIKNIKNLIIDALEDVTPQAICIHVSTNDIADGRNVDTIKEDMENLIVLVK